MKVLSTCLSRYAFLKLFLVVECACMHAKSLQLYLTLQSHRLLPTGLLCPWDSSGRNTGVGCHALIQGIFLTQGSNPPLLRFCIGRKILYHSCHLGSSSSRIFFIKWDFMCSLINMMDLKRSLLKRSLLTPWDGNHDVFHGTRSFAKNNFKTVALNLGFSGCSVIRNLPARQNLQETRVWSWVGKIPQRRKWQPTLVFLPGKFHGQWSLVGYSPWVHQELDMTEWLHMYTLSKFGVSSPDEAYSGEGV